MSVKELEKRLQSYGVQFSGSTKFDLMHLCEKNIQYSWPRLKYSIKPKIPRASHRICNVYGKRSIKYNFSGSVKSLLPSFATIRGINKLTGTVERSVRDLLFGCRPKLRELGRNKRYAIDQFTSNISERNCMLKHTEQQ